jgi:hypothetical protein
LTPGEPKAPDTGLPDALRTAVERTLSILPARARRPARASSTALSPERGAELLDEVARRGREARDELARRGGQARDELGRRGGQARDELGRRLEALERQLASIEDLLREQGQSKGKPKG